MDKNPIVYAVMANNLKLCTERLKAGCDINYIDNKSGTAIIQAIHSNNIILTKWLLDNGADLKVGGPENKNAVEYIRSNEMIELLMNYGVKFTNRIPEDGQPEDV